MTDDPGREVVAEATAAEDGEVTFRSPAFLARVARDGISRHGVIAGARKLRVSPLPSAAARLGWVLPASALIGLGVALLLAADLGLAPFDVWLSAVDQRTPLSHGQAAWATSGAFFVVASGLGVRPTFVGVVFVFVNGISVDLARQLIVTPDTLGLRLMMAASGLFLLTAGIALIVHTAATGGSFEAIMEAAERRGVHSGRVRTGLEVSVLMAGILAGGRFGVMTIVVALSLGPLLAATIQALADHRAGREARLESETAPVY
ncbi:MAG: hypothetical protein R2707_05625 [Acidimicrobiales bacterium]